MTTQASTQPPGTRPRRSRFERLADSAYSRRRRALPAWVAELVGVRAASSAVGRRARLVASALAAAASTDVALERA